MDIIDSDGYNSPLPAFDAFSAFESRGDVIEEKPAGLNCELKTYESRMDSKDRRIILEVGTRTMETRKNRDHDTAFVLTKIYDKYRELENTQLDIRSPFVKTALQEVIVRYPGIDFHAKIVVIVGPPRCIFHYRKELQAYGATLRDSTAARHLVFLLEHMYAIFETEMGTWKNFMESPIIPPRMDFSGLWMVFRPGREIYTRKDEVDQVLRLKDISRCECSNPFCPKSAWKIIAQELTFDGTAYGYITRQLSIRKYDGFICLEQLKIFPLEYHSNQVTITEKLTARGKKFSSLQKTHHRYYDGRAEAFFPWGDNDDEDCFMQKTNIKGRVMIDVATFCREKPSQALYIGEVLEPDRYETIDAKEANLQTRDFLICSYTVPGFCFTSKKWCIFNIELIEEIGFNSSAFETLLLPKHQKEMIHSLVKVHTSEGLGFDDLIRGKGKGMVFLLHGVPGTGKTLTAEGVADYTKRPLYTVSCGELGISTTNVEQNLSKALGLATSWNAIVLIDEADIFLEARSFNDLKRNGLVSIFLRLLEYYQGILILTTNRVNVFDPAIKSRIHLAIKYHALTADSRRDLWKVFVARACSGTTPEWLTEACLQRLAADEINGRQIKNTVRTAQALAISDGGELMEKHLKQSLNAMSMFERDFGEAEKDDDFVDRDGEVVQDEHHTTKRRRLY